VRTDEQIEHFGIQA